MKVMVSAYPNFRPVDMQATISVWEKLLEAYDDKAVAAALEGYIKSDTKGFAPAIGQIIDMLHSKPQEISELEAWGLVNRAIRNGTYGAEQEFERLPETVRKAVGSAGQIREWAIMDMESLQSVAQSNFLRSYRAVAERERKMERINPDLLRLASEDLPLLKAEEDEEVVDGIPMPEELKRRLDKWR